MEKYGFKLGHITYGETELGDIILKWTVGKLNREKGYEFAKIKEPVKNTA